MGPEIERKINKIGTKSRFFLERVPEAILERLGVENEVKMNKNPSTRRIENENGDFSKIVPCCRREHDS